MTEKRWAWIKATAGRKKKEIMGSQIYESMKEIGGKCSLKKLPVFQRRGGCGK